eukprot:6195647-Pleurochrysis_carterae.AAC.8
MLIRYELCREAARQYGKECRAETRQLSGVAVCSAGGRGDDVQTPQSSRRGLDNYMASQHFTSIFGALSGCVDHSEHDSLGLESKVTATHGRGADLASLGNGEVNDERRVGALPSRHKRWPRFCVQHPQTERQRGR